MTDQPRDDQSDIQLLREETAKFRALLHHANDLIYSVSIDPDAGSWKLEFLGDRIFDLSGCRPEEFAEGGRLGEGGPFGLAKPDKHPFELVHPDDLEEALASTRKLSAGQKVIREYRIRNRGTGEYRWVEDRSEPECDDQGRVVGIWGIVRDITERRGREDALGQLAAIVEVSDDAVVGLDADGRIVSWNSAAAAMYGYPPTDVVGRRFFEIVAPEDAAFLNEKLKAIAGSSFKVSDGQHVSRDGQSIPVSLTASAISDQTGKTKMVAVVVRDLTERKKLEGELLQSQKMDAVGRLAGGIAHDFNNILTVILGQTQTLIDDLSELDGAETLIEDARTVRKAAKRAADLTRQLLAFSRKQLMQPRPIDLNQVLGDTESMFKRILGEDIEMTIAFEGTAPVKADPAQVHQVLLNLAVNAREAMPEGGRLVLETSTVELDESYAAQRAGCRPGRYVMLAVSDTGTGMDAATRDKAFDPFFTTKEGGTGLGLSTVYGIVKQSGGNVWAYSEPGLGTTIKVYLPRIEGQPGATPDTDGESREALQGTETILVVEDEDGVRQRMQRTLESYGYSVLDAHDGFDACRISGNHEGSIDLVLTDLVMPRMNGLELARRIRAERPEVRVLYTSGYTDRFVSREVDRAELGSAFLQKPFTKAGLAQSVRETLSGGDS